MVDEAFTSRADEISILLGLWTCFVEVSAEDEGGLETSIVPIGPGNSGNAAADAKFAGVVVLVLAKRELARTDEVGGSLAARAPVAFGGEEAKMAAAAPALGFDFLRGGMMEMCANCTSKMW